MLYFKDPFSLLWNRVERTRISTLSHALNVKREKQGFSINKALGGPLLIEAKDCRHYEEEKAPWQSVKQRARS